MTRTAAALRALLVAVAAAGAGAVWPGPPNVHAAAEVKVAAREFLYVPKDLSAAPGDVTFVVTNEGVIEHNFVVEDAAKTAAAVIPIIEPRQTVQITATLHPGTYTIYCSLPGHREAGMVAALKTR